MTSSISGHSPLLVVNRDALREQYDLHVGAAQDHASVTTWALARSCGCIWLGPYALAISARTVRSEMRLPWVSAMRAMSLGHVVGALMAVSIVYSYS